MILPDLFYGLFRFFAAAAFSYKGFTVGALADGGIALVRADLHFIQRTVVGGLYVVLALRNGAGDAVVGSLFCVFHFCFTPEKMN